MTTIIVICAVPVVSLLLVLDAARGTRRVLRRGR
jgi:hypothetical protein